MSMQTTRVLTDELTTLRQRAEAAEAQVRELMAGNAQRLEMQERQAATIANLTAIVAHLRTVVQSCNELFDAQDYIAGRVYRDAYNAVLSVIADPAGTAAAAKVAALVEALRELRDTASRRSAVLAARRRGRWIRRADQSKLVRIMQGEMAAGQRRPGAVGAHAMTLTKRDIRFLERLFAAEVEGRLPFQSRAVAMIERLQEDQLIEPMEVVLPGRFPVTVRGWALTHRGRITYGEWAAQQPGEVADG